MSTPDAPEPTVEQMLEESEKPRRLVVLVKRLPNAMHKAFSVVAWLMPLILLALGYWFEELRAPVTWPWRAPAAVWGPMFLIFVILVIWMGFELFYATHRNTSVLQLQADDMGSLAMSLLLTLTAGGMLNAGTMEWWFLLPWLGSIADAATSGFFAINNAAQKPFVPTKGSS